jgi:hypothetical protein
MSQKLKIFSFTREVFCDRCNASLRDPYISVCPDCFGIVSESLRPVDIPFADNRHKICAVCARECTPGELKQLCPPCSSTHPDTTHANFGRNRETIVARCDKCGSLQVPHRGAASATYTYHRIGSATPTETPFACPSKDAPGSTRVEVHCDHSWQRILSHPPESGEPLEHNAARIFLTEENMRDLRDRMKSGSSTYWCHRCGSVSHVRGGLLASGSIS